MVYPNPITDQLDVQLAHSVNGYGYAELFNTGGTLIRKSDINIQNGQCQFEFSSINILNPGMYVLRIIQNNNILLTEKVVKGSGGL
ncbi:MAG TPA: hypothetical protein DCL77_17720 [Prolixibacteraceae bacterium]|nr:hypothetical protein [Prolixibacteraceae bacterium]